MTYVNVIHMCICRDTHFFTLHISEVNLTVVSFIFLISNITVYTLYSFSNSSLTIVKHQHLRSLPFLRNIFVKHAASGHAHHRRPCFLSVSWRWINGCFFWFLGQVALIAKKVMLDSLYDTYTYVIICVYNICQVCIYIYIESLDSSVVWSPLNWM